MTNALWQNTFFHNVVECLLIDEDNEFLNMGVNVIDLALDSWFFDSKPRNFLVSLKWYKFSFKCPICVYLLKVGSQTDLSLSHEEANGIDPLGHLINWSSMK